MTNKKRKGFTIVELVIVIAVVAILAAVLIPTFAGVIEKANESAALQEVKQAYIVTLAEDMTNEDGIYQVYGFEQDIIVQHANGTYVRITPDGNASVVENGNPTPTHQLIGGKLVYFSHSYCRICGKCNNDACTICTDKCDGTHTLEPEVQHIYCPTCGKCIIEEHNTCDKCTGHEEEDNNNTEEHTHTYCSTCGGYTDVDNCEGCDKTSCGCVDNVHTHVYCEKCGKCIINHENCDKGLCTGHEEDDNNNNTEDPVDPDDPVEPEQPSHEHTACPECGLCTDPECDGEATEKCAGHPIEEPNTGCEHVYDEDEYGDIYCVKCGDPVTPSSTCTEDYHNSADVKLGYVCEYEGDHSSIVGDHHVYCIECNMVLRTETHSGYLNDGKCEFCGGHIHVWEGKVTYQDNLLHKVKCQHCGKEETRPHVKVNAECDSFDENGHTLTCPTCGGNFTEVHSINDKTGECMHNFCDYAECKHEGDCKLDYLKNEKTHQKYCTLTNSAPASIKKYLESAKPHKDEDKNGVCDDCHYGANADPTKCTHNNINSGSKYCNNCEYYIIGADDGDYLVSLLSQKNETESNYVEKILLTSSLTATGGTKGITVTDKTVINLNDKTLTFNCGTNGVITINNTTQFQNGSVIATRYVDVTAGKDGALLTLTLDNVTWTNNSSNIFTAASYSAINIKDSVIEHTAGNQRIVNYKSNAIGIELSITNTKFYFNGTHYFAYFNGNNKGTINISGNITVNNETIDLLKVDTYINNTKDITINIS